MRTRRFVRFPTPQLPANPTLKTSSLGTEKTCAQVHPRLLTEELVRLSGAKVVIGTAVSLTLDPTTKRPKSVGVAATSSSTETEREIPATDVVLAAGPWIGDLAIKLLGPRIGGTLAVSGSRAHSIVLRTLEDVNVTPHALFTSLTLEDGSVRWTSVDSRRVWCLIADLIPRMSRLVTRSAILDLMGQPISAEQQVCPPCTSCHDRMLAIDTSCASMQTTSPCLQPPPPSSPPPRPSRF